NPIDVLADSQEDRYQLVLDIFNGENIGSILCILTPQQQTPVDKIADKIISFSETTHKVVMANFMGGEKIKSAAERLQKNNIPNFSFPDEAVEALDKYCRWNIFHSTKEKAKPQIDQERRRRAEALVQKIKSEGRNVLLFSEAEELMGIYGISVIETHDYGSNMNARFPLVAKVDSDKVLHKTEKQGVIIDIKDKGELDRAIAKLRSYFPGENVIIQPMSKGHAELIIGIKRDEIFGPVIIYGLGGIYAEVFRMVDFLMPPLDVREIEESLLKSKIRFLFGETRGKKSCSSQELAKILEAVGFLARENPEILELDINPLFIYNDGNKAIAADIKVII
ncbi:MAG: acetate--CoA ligase family protein, partial [Candidatus Moranbacteria bacterium]|nr:acetate--CoA ligase family protein [Candidatus Moranbacteria bacterium]